MTDEDGKQGARLRLHRLWALTIVMAVVLAVAGVTPAGAQSTATVRVSNLEAAETSQISPGEGQQYAQSFRTGSDSVTLEKVRLHGRTDQSNSAPAVSIRADSSGQPGATLQVLTNPAIDSDIATFEDFTTAGYVLAANTTYWVVVHRPRGTDSFIFSVTSSASEPVVDTGWSLGNNIRIALGNGWNGQLFDQWSMRMAILHPSRAGYSASLSHACPAAKAPSHSFFGWRLRD